MHDEPLPQCKKLHEDFYKHAEESTSFRNTVVKHDEQVLTLNRAHEASMEDIREIKEDIKGLRCDILGIKIWVLVGALTTMTTFAIPTAMLFYDSGIKSNQLNKNTEDIKELKQTVKTVRDDEDL
jgi:hypothetical protein